MCRSMSSGAELREELAAPGPGTASALLWQAADTWQHLQQKLGMQPGVVGPKRSNMYKLVVLAAACREWMCCRCISAEPQSVDTVFAECC